MKLQSKLPSSSSRPALISVAIAAMVASAAISACGGGDDTAPVVAAPAPVVAADPGRWTVGDLHVHTFQSDDTQQQNTLDAVLSKAFNTFALDWVTISDHLRVSSYDNNGASVSPSIPFSKGMALYQVPRIKALQAAGAYANKTMFSSFEWDMPTHDHANVGILTDSPMSAAALKAANQFEYLFTTENVNLFDPADVAAWNLLDSRANSTHADTMTAIAWLKKNYPDTSYLQINHPSRNVGKYTAAQLREMNDLAPKIVFSIEGMVGNQMEPDRGGYTQAAAPTTANLPNRTYGGVDYLVAKLGGTWDALLSEGRHIWTVADSDFHFKTNGGNSSGYAPGEYAKNHLYGDIKDPKSLIDAFRSGRLFGTYGDLISDLDFNVKSSTGTGQMGSDLNAKTGETLTVTIRFKTPARNNYEFNVNSGVFANVKPNVDHIDLIAGDITGKEVSGTAGYSRDTNSSTRVLKRFTASDWKLDSDGYYAITYTVAAANSMYFRLRGTNLGTDVAGETSAGEPLPDVSISPATVADNQTRFNAINSRNYSDLWFYSNPVFVKAGS